MYRRKSTENVSGRLLETVIILVFLVVFFMGGGFPPIYESHIDIAISSEYLQLFLVGRYSYGHKSCNLITTARFKAVFHCSFDRPVFI